MTINHVQIKPSNQIDVLNCNLQSLLLRYKRIDHVLLMGHKHRIMPSEQHDNTSRRSQLDGFEEQPIDSYEAKMQAPTMITTLPIKRTYHQTVVAGNEYNVDDDASAGVSAVCDM